MYLLLCTSIHNFSNFLKQIVLLMQFWAEILDGLLSDMSNSVHCIHNVDYLR